MPPTFPATTNTSVTPTTTLASDVVTVGVLEPEPCETGLTSPERVTCGFLVVPERPEIEAGPTVRLRFAVVAPATAIADQVPVVFLAGGPGYGSAGVIDRFLVETPMAQPVVLVDYRGVGGSEPFLGCPEDDAFGIEGLGLPPDDADLASRRRTAMQACHERLVGLGIDLAAYDYEHIAADLESLRAALGYEQWDLWGLSNGGRVALEIARRHPEGVRALVLDAAAPPQGNLIGELWSNAAVAFDQLFQRCAADQACAAAYPDLEATFEGLVTGLTESPIEVVVPDPTTGGEVRVRLDGVVALNAVRQAMYETPLLPLLPFFISELAEGRQFDTVARLIVDRTTPDNFSDGLAMSVNCREEIAFLAEDHFDVVAEQLPLFAPVVTLQAADDWCAFWDVGQAPPVIDEPVVSDIPALVLVGEFDPVHPEAAARSIAAGLANSTVVVVPALGHGTLFVADCPRQLLSSFLTDPAAAVDTTCVTAMPPVAWVVR